MIKRPCQFCGSPVRVRKTLVVHKDDSKTVRLQQAECIDCGSNIEIVTTEVADWSNVTKTKRGKETESLE